MLPLSWPYYYSNVCASQEHLILIVQCQQNVKTEGKLLSISVIQSSKHQVGVNVAMKSVSSTAVSAGHCLVS